MGRTTALVCAGILTLSLAPAATAATATAATASDAGGSVTLQAIAADSVVDAYGVGIHTHYLDTPYRDTEAVAAALADLGVRHVRDDLYLDAPQQYDAIARIAREGIGFDLIMGRPTDDATPVDYVDTVADELPAGAVESLEGVNEWDLSGRPQWPAEALAWQTALYAAAKTTPATADLPVLSPALAYRWNFPLVTGLDAVSDRANAHVYPGAYQPSTEIERVFAALTDAVSLKPVVTTEAGYHNALNTTSSHPPVPEDVAGAYLPRLLLEHLLRDDTRMYSYELIDEFADPGLTDPEAHFGLLRHDLSPKPAYIAMKSLLALLDDPGPSFDPGSLPVAVQGWPSDGRYLLTQKRDGRFVLLLWRDTSLWDPVTRTRQSVTPIPVTLGLGDSYELGVHRLDGTTPVAESTGTALTVDLDAEVTAVTIDPVTLDQPSVEPTPAAPARVTIRPRRHAVVVRWRSTEPAATSYRIRVAGRTLTAGPSVRRVRVAHLATGRTVRAAVRTVTATGVSPPTRSRAVRVR